MAGDWQLRIEDIDHTRCQAHFTEAIFEDLRWLGFDWPEPVLCQSANQKAYQEALTWLKSRGLTRTEAPSSQGPARLHDKISLDLEACHKTLGTKINSLGFVETGPKLHNQIGHFVPLNWSFINDTTIARSDIGLSYALCVVIDDAAQGITEVVRGTDLFEATHFHVLLQALLDLPTPHYHHHPLVLDDDGRKLAKRRGSRSIRDQRAFLGSSMGSSIASSIPIAEPQSINLNIGQKISLSAQALLEFAYKLIEPELLG